jgi:Uma2 family endonuclease
MATIIRDPVLEQQILAQRIARGGDRYDEVWEGVYIMPPMPNDEHQMLVGRFTRILDEVLGDSELGEVRPGVNLSDRTDGWQQNYRVPDVAVFLTDTRAVNYEAFWLGGPDFAIEIVSPGDQTRDKLEFYSRVGTRELLIVDRAPWQLELYRLNDNALELVKILELVGTATESNGTSIRSEIVSLEFKLRPGQKRPRIAVNQIGDHRNWTI